MNKVRSTAIFWTAVGAVAVWAWSSLPDINHPLGSDWGHYFTVAEYIWDPKDDLAYPDFRKPWFGWLMGGLGQWMGYFSAAQFIAKTSMVMIVFAAALMGSALANRWAGLASAFVVPLMPLVMDGALWVNHYPLLGACVALALSAGVAMLRSPWLVWPALSGLAAGAAYALDLRGSIAIPMVLALGVCGCIGEGWRYWVKRLGMLAVCGGLILAHDAWLQRAFNVPQLPFQAQLEVQRKGTLEQIGQGVFDNAALQQACADQKPGPIGPQAVAGECGRELARASRKRLSDMKIVPMDYFLWWIPVACVPLGRRKEHLKRGLASTIVFIVPVLSLWVGMRWVTYFDRYVMPFAVLFATVVPIGMANCATVISLISKQAKRWAGLVAAVASIWFSVSQWPGWTARSLDSPELAKSSEYHAGVFAHWARTSWRPGDSIIDCAGLAVDSLLLPLKIDYVRFPPGDPECNQRIQDTQPTGNSVYLITMHRDIPPQYGVSYLAFNPKAIGSYGWEPVVHDLEVDGFRLWRRP